MKLRGAAQGQTLVELALVLPVLTAVLVGIIGFGIAVFYQHQVTNTSREAARWAAVNSATAQCPTVSWLPAEGDRLPSSGSYYECDPPATGWPVLRERVESVLFGIDKQAVKVAACWSSYHQGSAYDAFPGSVDSVWHGCTINGVDPRTATGSVVIGGNPGQPCRGDAVPPFTIATDDTGSSTPYRANRVTAYACYSWSPPLAGFMGIPTQVTLRAVVTETIQQQQ